MTGLDPVIHEARILQTSSPATVRRGDPEQLSLDCFVGYRLLAITSERRPFSLWRTALWGFILYEIIGIEAFNLDGANGAHPDPMLNEQARELFAVD